MTRPTVHLTTTRPLHAVLDPKKPKPVAYLLRGKLAEPVYGLFCWECKNPVDLDEAAEFGWAGGYAYCLGDSPRTCCPNMALIDPLPKVSRVTKASKPRASERDSEWETKNSRSRKQNKRSKGGRKAQERDYA